MWFKYKACVNCGTTDRSHKGLGYCNKCYGPARQLKEVEAWDQSKPETLKRYPGNANRASPQDFELLREGYSLELRRRLDVLETWERSSEQPADGLQIEYQLDRIADHAGAKTHKLYHGLASYIDGQFPPEQRMVLRELLRRIEIDRPWRGVNLYRVFGYVEKRREKMNSSQA